MRQLRIGNVTLENTYILGPMAGVTDLPFRLLCKEQGAGLLCMEMVSAKAILYNNKNTETLLEIHPDEQPVSLQFFGSDPQIMSEMAKRVEERPFDIMDINMGCPVPKVVKNGEGSALMKNPKLAHEIISAMVKAIKKPVTVKIRKGFDDNCINAVEMAKIAEDAGAAAIAVHGRIKNLLFLSTKVERQAFDFPLLDTTVSSSQCPIVSLFRTSFGLSLILLPILNLPLVSLGFSDFPFLLNLFTFPFAMTF